MEEYRVDRREFLKVTGGMIGASLASGPLAALAQEKRVGKVNPMSIMVASASMDPVRPEMARAIADSLKAIGWDVEMNPMQYNQTVQKATMEHDYDMWVGMMSGSDVRIDPNIFIYMQHHSSEYKRGGQNWMGWLNPEVDKLAEAQQVAMDVKQRQAIVYKAQELINEGQDMNVLANMQMTNAYRSDRIKNVVPMMGEGIGSFWTDINMEVVQGDGYVRLARTSEIKNWNPVAALDTIDFMELRLVFDPLLRLDVDGTVKPWAAESYRIRDEKTIEITLRKNMLFHDGKPVTAEDVKFTFDYSAKWKAPYFFDLLQKVEEVQVTEPHALQIKLKAPYAPFLSNVLAGMYIIPKHIWQEIPEKVKLDDALKYPNEKPIGSGPFKFEYWERDREYKVSAFREHFSAPKCAGIIGVVYGSHDATAAAIEKGECDRTRYVLNPNLLKDLQKVKNVVAKGYPNHGFYALFYHCRRPPLTDLNFRKALAYVIPRGLIVENILSGFADPGGSVIAPVNKFWHNPAVKPFPMDVNRARKILADGGYTWDKEGKIQYPKA